MTLPTLANTIKSTVATVVGGKRKAGFGLVKYSTLRVFTDNMYI